MIDLTLVLSDVLVIICESWLEKDLLVYEVLGAAGQ